MAGLLRNTSSLQLRVMDAARDVGCSNWSRDSTNTPTLAQQCTLRARRAQRRSTRLLTCSRLNPATRPARVRPLRTALPSRANHKTTSGAHDSASAQPAVPRVIQGTTCATRPGEARRARNALPVLRTSDSDVDDAQSSTHELPLENRCLQDRRASRFCWFFVAFLSSAALLAFARSASRGRTGSRFAVMSRRFIWRSKYLLILRKSAASSRN
jgi:hypothetical protein